MEKQQTTQEKHLKTKNLFKRVKSKRSLVGLFLVLFVSVFALNNGKGAAGSWTVYPGNGFNPDGAGAYVASDCNGNKGCLKVMKMPNGSDATAKIYITGSAPRGAFVCASARGKVDGKDGPYISLFESSSMHGDPWAVLSRTNGYWTPKSSLTYHEYCIAMTLNSGEHFLYVTIRNFVPTCTGPQCIGAHPSDLYVAYIALKW